MNNYLLLFKKDRFVRVSPLFNIITIFDSLNYHRNDYDVLSASQRNHIGDTLLANNHKQQTGTSFLNLKTNQILKYINTGTLGVSPLNELQIKYNKEDVFIVTPGTYFLFLLMKLEEEASEEVEKEILQLISKHPVNLEQLLNQSKIDKFYELFRSRFSEFKKHQNDAIANELKGKRPLGSLF